MYTYNGSHYQTRLGALVAACCLWLGDSSIERDDTAESLSGAMIADRWTAGAITDESGESVAYSRNEYADAMADALHMLGKVK